MAYKVKRRTATIVLGEDTGFEGLEMRCVLSVPMKDYFGFLRAVNDLGEYGDQAFRDFGEKILDSWNAEDDNGPIPANAEGFLSLEPLLCTQVLLAWVKAVQNPPAPLAEPSSGGSTSREEWRPTAVA